ncbi:alpha/beta hydrolase [Massilia sp. erpn]|uniref:alpha/beta hydrolase n=1 Tax=Massilia sp. erpn TaxID=2738142 RepID=UPI0021066C91|nr:alpha/beta hydrolase-fold protein [Massilia sp. erpn]UTY59511.1 alpha/beta hydrolase [Massilia sp. erpn]
MRHLRRLLFCLSCLLAPIVHGAAIPDGEPYSLPNTFVHQIPAAKLKRDYQIFVSLPKNYSPSGPALPVVFVTDADYAFPVVRAITGRVGGNGKRIGQFVLVGLSYALGDTPEFSRRRDYTPTRHEDDDMESDMPGRKPVFGEAAEYRRYLISEVLPFVQAKYKVDMEKSVFVGHSYGALLGTDILLNAPDTFGKYVLSSPSLWFNKRFMFGEEKLYSKSHRDLNAKVFFAVGGLETAKRDKAGNTDDDMVRDVREFNAALKSRRYPSLHTQLHVLAGQDHATVFPDMITKALEWAVAGRASR